MIIESKKTFDISRLYEAKNLDYNLPNNERFFLYVVYENAFDESVIDVDMLDRKGVVDCCATHFGYNFYFRTPYGVNKKRYSNVASLTNAIKKVSKSKGLEIKKLYVQNLDKSTTIHLV